MESSQQKFVKLRVYDFLAGERCSFGKQSANESQINFFEERGRMNERAEEGGTLCLISSDELCRRSIKRFLGSR